MGWEVQGLRNTSCDPAHIPDRRGATIAACSFEELPCDARFFGKSASSSQVEY